MKVKKRRLPTKARVQARVKSIDPFDKFDFDEEVSRTMFQEISQPPPVRFNAILATIICTLLLTLLGFVVVHLPDPYSASFKVKESMSYSFQIPFAVFIGVFLGAGLGLTASLFYLILGFLLAIPVFSNGGGLDYFYQPGFGYIAGMMIGAWVAGKFASAAFNKQGRCGRSLVLIAAAIVGCLAVHLAGAFYLLFTTIAGVWSWREGLNWLILQSAAPVLYDIISAVIMVSMARLARLSLWLALY